MRLKKAVKYHGISLPSPLIEEVKKYIIDRPEYRSVAEFTKEAIREKMRKE
jgi:metal-responsive CopG/Arc/MetJ family transcriptional regulator